MRNAAGSAETCRGRPASPDCGPEAVPLAGRKPQAPEAPILNAGGGRRPQDWPVRENPVKPHEELATARRSKWSGGKQEALSPTQAEANDEPGVLPRSEPIVRRSCARKLPGATSLGFRGSTFARRRSNEFSCGTKTSART